MDREESRRILVPLDGSMSAEGPLAIASALAELMEGELHALHVAPEVLSEDAMAARARIPRAWRERVRLHSGRGDAIEEIRRVAAELHSLAVVISSHGATRDLKVPAGHVTLGVLADPPCPVMVVRSALSATSQTHRIRHLRRILAPLDGSPEAALSIDHACAIAIKTQARVMILHVIDVSGKAPAAAPAYGDQSQYEMEAWEDEFLRSSFARAPRPAELKAQVALRCGEPGNEIANFAQDEDCDLIVAAWGGRLSPGRAVVIRTLLERAPCPLLFLRAGPR
jgi:nucleotide-binding universal stress UspA family protein